MIKRVMICFVFVMLLGFVSAEFNVSNYEITKDKYSPQNFLEAWLEMSLDGEFSNSVFETNVGNSIELSKLLDLNNAEKSCVPSDCESAYSADGEGKTSLNFNLESGKSKIVGLKFSGDISSIDYVNFSLQSNAAASCENQIEIDFLADGDVEKINDKTSEAVCGSDKNYGCFDSNEDFERTTIEQTPYCQKINLSKAAGFNVGAWVKKGGIGSLEMVVYDENANEKATCDLPEPTEAGSEISCDVAYSLMEEQEHYVCIRAKNSVTDHQVKSSSVNKCGFFGTPIKSATTSYQIFAQSKKFDAVGTINIENNGQILESYLLDKYNLDCEEECVVPIKITGYGDTQTITLSNLDSKYRKTSGNILIDEFYELVESPAKINMDAQKIYLDNAEFAVTDNMTDYGNKSFVLNFKGEEIFSKKIFIEKVSTIESVTPLFSAAANPTEFVVNVNEKNNSKIVSYKWEFGDGTNQTTLENKTTHTYDEIKNYDLKITIVDENGYESFKTFNITVNSPKEIVDSEIDKKLGYVENLKEDVDEIKGYYNDNLRRMLKLNETETKLNELRTDYNNATSDEDYIEIMKELVNLRIPKYLDFVERVDSQRFYPLEANVNLDILKTIGGGSYEESLKEEYERAVNDWMINNLDVRITSEEVVGRYEQNDEAILKIFELDIQKISGEDYYIVLNNFRDLDFKESYSEVSEEGYDYIKSNGNEVISFVTTSDFDFIDLPVFFSPAIKELNVFVPGVCNGNGICDGEENWRNCGDCDFSWTIIWVVLGVIVVGILIYVILYILYKRKYEGHLFKDRNSLYNVLQYVHGAEQRGIDEKKVRENLKKAGWDSEQIRYATRKYRGKETGLWNPFKAVKDINKHRKV